MLKFSMISFRVQLKRRNNYWFASTCQHRRESSKTENKKILGDDASLRCENTRESFEKSCHQLFELHHAELPVRAIAPESW